MSMLQLDSVTKRYGDLEALHELSLQVRDGEIFGFVGANGAGKTTTMRVVLGVLEADAGDVLWNGAQDHLRAAAPHRLHPRGSGPLSEDDRPLAADLLRALARHDAPRRPRCVDRMARTPRSRGPREEPAPGLSHGNQQRVQLAAALVFSPELLVLDEPFAGLDPVAVDAMSDVLRAQAERGKPVVVSSHQLDIVERRL